MIDHMLRQRACRSFTDDTVGDDDLATMLRAATHAPSAENSQPWVFVVVRDPDVRLAVVELTRRVWDGGARQHAEQHLHAPFLEAVDTFVRAGYGGAPVLVVVAGDARGGASDALLASSVFPAAQNLLLSAAALGYGSSMTTLAAHAPEELARLLALPEGVRPFAVVPIGRPAGRLGPPRRRPVHEVAHLDSFGVPYVVVSDQPPAPAARQPPAPPRSG